LAKILPFFTESLSKAKASLNQPRTANALARDEDSVKNRSFFMLKCKECEGYGFIVVAGHGCENEKECREICPVAIQEQCEACKGEGYIDEESDENE